MPTLLGTRRVPYFATAWTPRSLPGLVLWLDAATIGQADNTAVGLWRDQSGQGNHASQGTTAAQPTFLAAGINGHPALNFDGTDDALTNTLTSLLPADAARTVYAVGLAVNRTSSGGALLTLRLTPTYSSTILLYLGGTNNYIYGDGANIAANVTVASLAPILSPFVASHLCYGGAVNPALWLGGQSQPVTSVGTHQSIEAGTTGFAIGTNASNQQWWNGSIAHLLVYAVAHSDAQRHQAEAYLSRRYGIPVVAQ